MNPFSAVLFDLIKRSKDQREVDYILHLMYRSAVSERVRNLRSKNLICGLEYEFNFLAYELFADPALR